MGSAGGNHFWYSTSSSCTPPCGTWPGGEQPSVCSPANPAGPKPIGRKNGTTRMHRNSRRQRRATPTLRKRRVSWLVGGAVLFLVGLLAVLNAAAGPSGGVQAETPGDWTGRYAGDGRVPCDAGTITPAPQAAGDHDTTHGGRVHTTGQCRDADCSVTLNTETPVRQESP